MGLIWQNRLPVAVRVPDWAPPIDLFEPGRVGCVHKEQPGRTTQKQHWGAPQKRYQADIGVVVSKKIGIPHAISNLPFSANNSNQFTGGVGSGAFGDECS